MMLIFSKVSTTIFSWASTRAAPSSMSSHARPVLEPHFALRYLCICVGTFLCLNIITVIILVTESLIVFAVSRIIFFDSSAMATWNFFTSRGSASSAGFSTLKTFSPEGSDRSIRGLFPPATFVSFPFWLFLVLLSTPTYICKGGCSNSNPSFAGRVFLKKLGHDWELRKVDEQLCSICQRLVATSSFTTPPSNTPSSSDPSKACHLPGSKNNCTPSIAIQVISNNYVFESVHIQYGKHVYDILVMSCRP